METSSVYQKNLDALKAKHPDLYQTLMTREVHDDDVESKVYTNRSGLPLVIMEDRRTGKIVRLHDEDDPEGEAFKIADSINIGPGDVRFLIGMGLGYVPLEIIKRSLPQLKLFIVEPNLKLFIDAIKNLDLTSVFEAEGVSVMIGEPDDIKPVISRMEADIPLLMKGAEITFFEPERELFPDFFAVISKKIQDQVGHLICGVHTADKIGPVFFENSLWNFTTVMNSANLGVLDGIFKNRTVLVVGAGPSLHENLPLIKKYRSKFAIITVDSSLPVLIKNGIIPDLATTVDYHHISFEKYRDVIEKTSEIPIVFAAQCATMTIKPYRCPVKFFIAQPLGIYSDLAHSWKHWANWSHMQAVSHLAVSAANVTRADRIILAGFDLAFVGLKSYAEGTSLTYNFDIESLVWVKDQFGEAIPTTIQMVGQKALMEHHISIGSADFFNIGRGVSLQGAKSIDFEPFISSLPDIGINVFEEIKALWRNAPKPSNEMVIEYLDQAEKDLNRFSRLCDKGKDAAKIAIKKLEKSDDKSFSRCGHLVEKAVALYEKITSSSSAIDTALSFFEGKDISLKMDEVRLGIDNENLSKRLKISAEMDFIVRAAEARKSAALRLIKDFTRLHGRLLRETKLIAEILRKDSGKARAEAYTKLGHIYLDYMDFVQAEDAFRLALEENESSGDALAGLGKTLGRLKRHSEALECFAKAIALSPDSEILRKAYEHEKTYPERALSEASSYVQGDLLSLGGARRENWALRIANEIHALYPDNIAAAEIAEKARNIISATKDRQEKILPYVMAGPEKAIEMIEDKAEEDLDFAIRVLELLRKQHSANASVLEYLGLLYLAKNDLKNAKKFFAQARSLAPDSYSPRVHLARILVSEGSLGEALMYIEQAQMLAPPEIAESFSESMADLLFELGRHEEALAHYKKAAVSFPENAGIIKKIGDVYAAMGIMDAARHAWKASGLMDVIDE